LFARTYVSIYNYILLCSLLSWAYVFFIYEVTIKLKLRTFFWNKISLTQFLFFYTQSTNPTLFLLIQNASKHYQKSMTKKQSTQCLWCIMWRAHMFKTSKHLPKNYQPGVRPSCASVARTYAPQTGQNYFPFITPLP